MTKNSPLDFFPGFAWALPRAFAEPLSTCRFEQGDILFEKEIAYHQPWSEAIKSGGRALQVLAPSRGVVGKSPGQDDSAFADSWQQEVSFTFFDLGSKASKTLTTTQGRLFTLLWKGDLDVLADSTASPTAPNQASVLKKKLPQVIDYFQGKFLPEPAMTRFLMPYDNAAGLYREKFLKVKNKLESEFETTVRLESANDLGLDREFLPTVYVASFEMRDVNEETVEKALQDVLYKPSAGRKTEDSRFRLKAHGLVI